MPSYDFCRKCGCQRYVDGWHDDALYLDAGWRKEQERHFTSKGIEFERVQWICPGCMELERLNQADWEYIMNQDDKDIVADKERLGDGHRGEKSDD
jgi:hypothetical protein